MNVGRSEESIVRSYFINASGSEYYVNDIHFYDEDGIVVSTGWGWLEKDVYINDVYVGHSEDIKSIDIPVDEIKRKNKLDFDGKVFVMKSKNKLGKAQTCDLYIPADMFNVRFVENYISPTRDVYALYNGDCGIAIRKLVKRLDDELCAIRNNYKDTYEDTDYLSMYTADRDSFLAKLDELKELAVKYYAEKERIASLTIEDIEL